jgi:hypothetical protein
MTTTSSLRWGRIVLGGFLPELVLILAVIPMRTAGSSDAAVNVLAMAGSFFLFVPVAWWLGRTLPRPILHGVLMGAFATVIYLVLQVLATMFAPEPPTVPWFYYVGHALKLAGGATGGWFAARSSAASRTPARV